MTMARTTSEAGAPRLRSSHALAVLLRRLNGGPVLAVESVTERDLFDALAELWFEANLRKGHPDVAPETVEAELTPLYLDGWSESGPSRNFCAGFALSTRNSGDETIRRVFGRSAVESVARRAARKLIATGALENDDETFYELRVEPASEGSERLRPSALAQAGGAPLSYAVLPLAPLLERAEAVNVDPADDHFKVFYTRAARERAERLSRKGGSVSPPVETGGLLIGSLCSCPDTGDMFAVVVDVLEATHAEGTTYSLTYSGETWARIQAVMRARGANPATKSHRILGQCHGHSFLPLDGAAPCEDCLAREVCSRTTCFLSEADLVWLRAVFHGQPWQLSHIFGFDAQGREVDAFFGQGHGRLGPRGYHLISDFELPPIPTTPDE